jgi:secondary thiamine-phosphate synthase enzyme
MAQIRIVSRGAPSVVTATTIVTAQLAVEPRGRGFVDLTAEIERFIAEAGASEGVVTLFIRHTSASLTIQENADPSVLTDLATALDRLAPEDAGWTHDTEGPDDMPAHVKAMLTSNSLQVPVVNGAMALGTWQAIYLIEHRARAHRREVVVQFIGRTRPEKPT